ncbi:PREDICTED: dynein regulatory complex protein 1-like [Amphimedon queenslandica]|uniref:Dynein regulatory complex protein 1 n=1 Tax=Amphimedon queenslandica TaxID=400682 RepID=A0A1X7UL97_AMPQE|nr:PREDICTED: dynein regulatory complex protein 1-like [Amphimedon queenslandica]|eukprot:XP_003387607.1 PREDICTED: dynein regulatory complex protein 1-like [Amphimedon queenslandica]
MSATAKAPGLHTTSLLDSSEERKQQRRSRVKVKLEDARRRALGIRPETPPEDDSDPEQGRLSSQQILKSKERLKKLVSDGYQLVTGVLVAGESREVTRRQEETEAKKACSEKIEAEANAAVERFDEIMRKWTNFESKNEKVPQDLHILIQQQKKSCDEMLDEKNKLINEFEEDLKLKDEQFVKHLKKEAEDVDLLVERMEEQARSLVRAFQEELNEIEKSFSLERQELVEKQTTSIRDMTQTRSEKESEYIEIREKRLEENEAKINHIRMRNAEELNEIKIKLETDIQHLQQQIQQMKATFQLNAEKLEYNYQVLKKRDEENMIIISQQKRKLTRLQDVLNNLHIKLSKQEKHNRDEIESLMAEYQKNIEQYKELQKKFKHFQLIDAKRFYDIWQMNEERIRSVCSSVCQIDEIIHKQQLGLEWQAPTQPASPLQPFLMQMNRDVSNATMYASQILSDPGDADEAATGSAMPSTSHKSFPFSTMKHILELIANEGSFLLESKLAHLLSPLDKEEQMLMKLDSIFKALNVTSEHDVNELMKFFVKSTQDDDSDDAPIVDFEIFDPNQVPHILKQFTETRQSQLHASSSNEASNFKVLGLHGSDGTEELLKTPFWSNMTNLLPKEHKKMWTALTDSLEKYHSILSTRSKLLNETEGVRQQNSELRLLLHQYMHSSVNKELEVPPVMMMPIATGTH